MEIKQSLTDVFSGKMPEITSLVESYTDKSVYRYLIFRDPLGRPEVSFVTDRQIILDWVNELIGSILVRGKLEQAYKDLETVVKYSLKDFQEAWDKLIIERVNEILDDAPQSSFMLGFLLRASITFLPSQQPPANKMKNIPYYSVFSEDFTTNEFKAVQMIDAIKEGSIENELEEDPYLFDFKQPYFAFNPYSPEPQTVLFYLTDPLSGKIDYKLFKLMIQKEADPNDVPDLFSRLLRLEKRDSLLNKDWTSLLMKGKDSSTRWKTDRLSPELIKIIKLFISRGWEPSINENDPFHPKEIKS